MRSEDLPHRPEEHVATQELPSRKVAPSHETQVVALVEQVAQGALQDWHVRSVVRPHFPDGQLEIQDEPSKNVEPSQVTHLVALEEQVTHGAVQV